MILELQYRSYVFSSNLARKNIYIRIHIYIHLYSYLHLYLCLYLYIHCIYRHIYTCNTNLRVSSLCWFTSLHWLHACKLISLRKKPK